MIRIVLAAALLATPVSGSIKDAPGADMDSHAVKEFWEALEQPPRPRRQQPSLKPVPPAPQAAPFVYVEGYDDDRFRLPDAVMKRWNLHSGQTISRNLARHIANELRYGAYSETELQILKTMDEKEKQEQ